MCNPMVFMAASMAATAIGSARKGQAQKQAAGEEAADMEYQADLARDQGQAEASRIRRAGRRARGEAVAAIAASGVKVGEGSALDAERQVMQDYEQDAAIAILNGDRQGRVLDQRARARRRGGRTAATATYIEGAGSLLDQGSSMFGKKKG